MHASASSHQGKLALIQSSSFNVLLAAAGCPLVGCQPRYYPTVRAAVTALGLQLAGGVLEEAVHPKDLDSDLKGVLLLPTGEAIYRVFEMFPQIAATMSAGFQ